MVVFKTLKFKHYRKSMGLRTRENAEEDVYVEYLAFAVSMVAEWDFVNEDTGEPLLANKDAVDELSLPQVKELAILLNRAFSEMSQVPKTNAEPSPSASTPLSQVESPEKDQSG